jgi:hypothetical protein
MSNQAYICRISKKKGTASSRGTCKAKRACIECRHYAPKPADPDRLAVACSKCQMWFDTDKGWRGVTAMPNGIPLCPCCKAPLMQSTYESFVQELKETGDWAEVQTWEYPTGAFWKVRGVVQ